MRFAALMPQKDALKGHVVLARRCASERFEKIETYSPRNHVHVFRLRSEDDFDETFRSFIGESYRVGRQEHIDGPHQTAAAVAAGGSRRRATSRRG